MAVKEVSAKEARLGVRDEPGGSTAPEAPTRSLAATFAPGTDITEGPIGTRLYWLGTLDQSPVDVVHLGGVAFQRTTDRMVHVLGERLPRKYTRRGSLVHLTDVQIEAIKQNARTKLVRTTGKRAVVIQINSARSQVRYPSDEPIGSYVYLLLVEDAAQLLGPGWHDAGTPPPMIAPATRPAVAG